MQAGYLLQVFLRHTFDTCICRVGGQGHVGLFEPVAEGLGMNAKQTSTVCDRKKSHTLRTPFVESIDGRQHTHRFPGTPALPGNFLDVWDTNALENKAGNSAVSASQDQPAFRRRFV
jgi:hypothetical protein